MGAPGKQPLSLEALAQRRAAEREANSKPQFLSKEERAKLALERRAREVEQIRERQLEEKQQRTEFFARAQSNRDRPRRGGGDEDRDRGRDRDRNRDRDRDRDRPRRGGDDDRDRARRHDDDDRRRRSRSRSPPRSSSSASTPLTAEEMGAIRSRYMGLDAQKRKPRRTNDRRFVFDWDEGEDTSRDSNPLYARRADVQPAFGRGHVGGITAADLNDKIDTRNWRDKPLAEMRDRDWRILKEDFDITTKGGQIPHPLRSWRESQIPTPILRVIQSVGYKEPTPIQRQTIPIGLARNRDIIGIAETGSGKTASFLVPMLAFIMKLPKITEENAALGPYALILVPTRELAQQIEQEAIKFAKPLGYKCLSIVGGHAIEEQSFVLSQGVDIVIATPGRLRDCLERHIVVLGQCTYVVMDEADRMIDMGFEADVTYILEQLPVSNVATDGDPVSSNGEPQQPMEVDSVADAAPPEERRQLPEAVRQAMGDAQHRHTVMFSATMPPQVERLAQRYLRKPATVIIGSAGKAVDTVQQHVEFISDENGKRHRLLELCAEYDPPIIVFFNQKRAVDAYAKTLGREGYRVSALHGGKSQDTREAAIEKLRRGDADILLATNVAGRGLDVPNVQLVVNFDMAKNIEEYTHRIGRTGRAGKKGTAVTFLGKEDTEVLYDLKNMLLKSSVSRCPPELANHPDAQVKPGTFVAKRKHEETLFAK